MAMHEIHVRKTSESANIWIFRKKNEMVQAKCKHQRFLKHVSLAVSKYTMDL